MHVDALLRRLCNSCIAHDPMKFRVDDVKASGESTLVVCPQFMSGLDATVDSQWMRGTMEGQSLTGP